MIRAFVSGASGNVGRTIVRTIAREDGLSLAGGWCIESGRDLGEIAGIGALGIVSTDDLDAGLAAAAPDVVIDFSSARVLADNMRIYLDRKLDAVIGTTGLTDERLAPFVERVAELGLRWAVIPNYGLGISLVEDFIRRAREFYPFVSIVDRHPHTMANAPSGTAMALAKAAGAPSGAIESSETLPCALGGNVDGVRVHSQRMPWPGPYSGHEITLARHDEVIRVSVEDFSSDIYMDGVLMTARRLATFPAGTFLRSLAEVMRGSA